MHTALQNKDYRFLGRIQSLGTSTVAICKAVAELSIGRCGDQTGTVGNRAAVRSEASSKIIVSCGTACTVLHREATLCRLHVNQKAVPRVAYQ